MAQNRKKKKVHRYSADGIALRFGLGLLLIAFGVLVFLSMAMQLQGDVFNGVRTLCTGLCGCLGIVLTAVAVWGGVLVCVSSQRKTATLRYFCAACVLLVLALTAMNLFSYTSGGHVMDLQKKNLAYADATTYYAAMVSFGWNGCARAGGAVGMLLGCPIHAVLGSIGGGIVVILLILALIALMLPVSPVELFHRLRERTAGRAQRRDRQDAEADLAWQQQRARVQQAPEAPWQPDPADTAYAAQNGYGVGRQSWPEQNAPAGYPPMATAPRQPVQASGSMRPVTSADSGVGFRPVSQESYIRATVPGTGSMENDPLAPVTVPKKKKNPRKHILSRPEEEEETLQPEPATPQPTAQPAVQPAAVPQPVPTAPAQPVVQAPAQPVAAVPAQPAVQPAAKPGQPRTAAKPIAQPAPVQTATPVQAAAPVQPAAPVTVAKPVTPPAATERAVWSPDSTFGTAQRQSVAETPETDAEAAAFAPPVLAAPPASAAEGGRRRRRGGVTIDHAGQTPGQLDINMIPQPAAPQLPETPAQPAEPAEEKPYVFPPLALLRQPKPPAENSAELDGELSKKLVDVLKSFKVQAEVRHVTHGPAISRFEMEIAQGIRVNKITELDRNIAMNMEVKSVRIEAPIPGTSLVGVEVPNRAVSAVTLKEVLDTEVMRNNTAPLTVALGKDIAGAPILCDLSRMPHLLIAGATGSGKSVCINTIINSLLYRCSPKEVRLILVDPKVVELQCYNGIPHLLIPVVSDPHKASGALEWAVGEMMERYARFSERGVREIRGYNAHLEPGEEPMPRIVIIIDELADLMMTCKKDVEERICRLAQLARAAGMHLIVATQRPSVDVITGLIKANIPSRIAFKVSSFVDSRTILDRPGADKLLGYGDMLYLPNGEFTPIRVQGCFLSDDEVNSITEFICKNSRPNYDEAVIEQLNHVNEGDGEDGNDIITGSGDDGTSADNLLQQAVEMTVQDGQTSTSMLQRRLRIGYARAGRLVDEMEKRGIISQKDGAKPRMCLISREDLEQLKLNGGLKE